MSDELLDLREQNGRLQMELAQAQRVIKGLTAEVEELRKLVSSQSSLDGGKAAPFATGSIGGGYSSGPNSEYGACDGGALGDSTGGYGCAHDTDGGSPGSSTSSRIACLMDEDSTGSTVDLGGVLLLQPLPAATSSSKHHHANGKSPLEGSLTASPRAVSPVPLGMAGGAAAPGEPPSIGLPVSARPAGKLAAAAAAPGGGSAPTAASLSSLASRLAAMTFVASATGTGAAAPAPAAAAASSSAGPGAPGAASGRVDAPASAMMTMMMMGGAYGGPGMHHAAMHAAGAYHDASAGMGGMHHHAHAHHHASSSSGYGTGTGPLASAPPMPLAAPGPASGGGTGMSGVHPEDVGKDMTGMRCRNCGQFGHIMRYCTHVTCFHCGRPGHMASVCPQAHMATPGAAPGGGGGAPGAMPMDHHSAASGMRGPMAATGMPVHHHAAAHHAHHHAAGTGMGTGMGRAPGVPPTRGMPGGSGMMGMGGMAVHRSYPASGDMGTGMGGGHHAAMYPGMRTAPAAASARGGYAPHPHHGHGHGHGHGGHPAYAMDATGSGGYDVATAAGLPPLLAGFDASGSTGMLGGGAY